MMQIAQLVENREIIRGEANLNGFSGGKYPLQSVVSNKSGASYSVGENKGNTTFLIRAITLTLVKYVKKEPQSIYPMLSFKQGKRMDYASGVTKSTQPITNVKWSSAN